MIFNAMNVAGGGSSSDASLFVVNIASYDSGRRLVCDKTVGEILEAFNDGMLIWFKWPTSGNTYHPMQFMHFENETSYMSFKSNDTLFYANGNDAYPTFNAGGSGGAG